MKLHPATIAQTQQGIVGGQQAAIEAFYSHALAIGPKAEMASCLVQVKAIGARLWLTVWPQTGDPKQPTTHHHLGRGTIINRGAASIAPRPNSSPR